MHPNQIGPAIRRAEEHGHNIEPWSMRCRWCGRRLGDLEHPCLNDVAPGKVIHLAPEPETRRTRVYVSGPLTTGTLTTNVRRACEAASVLLERGFAVYLPHTNVLWEIVTPARDPYETWLAHDFEWVGACDVVLRLDGASSGGDREVTLARKLGREVYLSLDSLIACEKPTRPWTPISTS